MLVSTICYHLQHVTSTWRDALRHLFLEGRGSLMPDDAFLTVAEVAARLRVNPETVRRWLRHGRLRGVLMGGDRAGYRIAESEVQRFLREELGASPSPGSDDERLAA